MDFRDKSIKEIKEWLESVDYLPPEPEFARLLGEKRSGVIALLERIHRKRSLVKQQEQLWQEMSINERRLHNQGYRWIAGVDEVGRGPLAGPVVSAAVILPEDFYLPGLNDSKKLSKQTREEYYEIIQQRAISIGVAIISVEIIDQINILQATYRGMTEAVAKLATVPDYILVDALTLPMDVPQEAIIGGDSKSVSIAAASVIAKVTRDRIMSEMAAIFPQYGFDQHMGYGTKEHLEAIVRHGVTVHHRRTFAGVKEWV